MPQGKRGKGGGRGARYRGCLATLENALNLVVAQTGQQGPQTRRGTDNPLFIHATRRRRRRRRHLK